MRPIACTLDDRDRAQRRARWHVLSPVVEQTPDGLRIACDNVTELRALAQLEQECCAFASWDVVLEVRAETPDGVAALHAMF